MIVFDLACLCGYQFEAWFQDSAEYRRQVEEGFLRCPRCEDTKVHKVLSPVTALRRVPQRLTPSEPTASPAPDEKKVLALLKGLQEYITKNFEDVGASLATTALKIHYGIEEDRNIRGVATAQEEEMLSKEGIHLVKVPIPVEEDDSN